MTKERGIASRKRQCYNTQKVTSSQEDKWDEVSLQGCGIVLGKQQHCKSKNHSLSGGQEHPTILNCFVQNPGGKNLMASGFDNSIADGITHQFTERFQAKAAHNAGAVIFSGAHADIQRSRYLFIALA